MQDPHEATYRTAPPAQATPRLDRNIRAVLKQREDDERSKTAQEQISQRITNFAGSLNFVCLHVLAFGAWIIANLGLVPKVPVFDPTFAMLAMIASVEAIFVTTFVLISQNRMARDDARRADLNLQISLLAEQEATRLLALVSTIAERLDVKTDADATLDELATEITPEQVLHRLDEREAEPRE
ncbi:DUF1003 domain-containing protein [Sinorhizobium alkalisoli]|uniref:DUF1003 domain-containing protein n=1 Tax=Sinorhizobium alkalisoli TaxID=1752398 RepID=UPI00124D29EC|nr:DUF1003 domain-containing protein [Sinorhizobium alkalisoli]QFI69944.1 hypothetical protein EKH55_5070 [Sinorhizobium alkalisoli]